MSKIKRFNESSDIDNVIKSIENGDPSWKWIQNLRNTQDYVPDGVYDISDIEYFVPDPPRSKKWVGRNVTASGYEDLPNAKELMDKWNKEFINFIKKYPNFVIADAYQTEYPLFLSEMPTKKVKYIGSGFNHGSNNIIDNCPKRILICGEDD